jgi:endonuclease/exonuclease/phosphatase (EEP) superfamily protein YafD
MWAECGGKVGPESRRAPKQGEREAWWGRIGCSSSERSVVEVRARNHWKRLAFLVATGATVVLAPLTLVPLFGWVYPLELFCHFQVQYLVAAAVCAAVLAGLGRWRWSLAAAGCALVAAMSVLPFESGQSGRNAAHATAVSGHDRGLRLLLANVLVSNRQRDRVLDLVAEADADVLVFQEVDDRWMAALVGLQREYPYGVGRSRNDAFGIAVFSRIPLEQAQCLDLGGAGRPSAIARLSVDGIPISIVATHPMHPLSPRTFGLRNDQLEAVGDYAAGLDQPLVLIGDLNVTMWSPWYRRLCEQAQLTDARLGFGVRASWPTFLPSIMRLPIDHCLVSDELVVTDCRLGPVFGSDHRPLIVDVAVP